MSLILFSLAAFFNAVSDTLNVFFERSIFKNLNPLFWNPKVSYHNKWKDGDQAKGEKFLFSSTLFSGFTDGWHLSKLLMLTSLMGAIVSYNGFFSWYIDLVFYILAWFITFETSYKLLRK